MAKDILFGKIAMDKMLKGFDTAYTAVSGTLGPKGKNVYLDDPLQPKITNDGFTIAGHLRLADKQEDAGAYVIRNITSQQNDDVGDGTTTVAVLAQAIIQECLKRPESPLEIRQSLKSAEEKVLAILKKRSIVLKPEDVEKVALISSENTQIAKLIAEIIQKLGNDATVNIEDSKTFETNYEIVDGYKADVGFMSPHFITDKKSGKAIYSDVPILISEKKIANISDIAPIFEMFKKEGINQCVVVCDDIDDAILGLLVQNKLIGTFNSLVIRASTWLLQDIEGATGAKAVGNNSGVTFQTFKKEYLGWAKKVISTNNQTLFTTDGIASKQYAKMLEMQAENEPNSYAAEKIRDRVAKLKGGLAVLKIGAATDFERDYLRLKTEDSVKAVEAALAEGIVLGSGMTFWLISQELEGATIGLEILKKALQAPLKKILENAGKDYIEIASTLNENVGYDVKDGTFCDLLLEGIIDPTKVERCALTNAVSAAGIFITTHAILTEREDDKSGI